MATSFGSITIVDNTDFGQLIFQLSGSTVRQQQKDINTTPATYYPNWVTTPLTVTPLIFYDGQAINLNDTRINTITWYHTAYDRNNPNTNKITSTSSSQPEYLVGKTLQRNTNLTNEGRKFIAVLTFKPFSDLPNTLEAIAEIDFTLTEYGENGSAAKALQLIGDGSHFIYQYTGELINNTPITLTAQIQNIEGIRWYCDNNLIYVDGNGKPTLNSANNSIYTASTLSIVGKSTTGYVHINELSSNFASSKEAQFKVVETDGTQVIANGFEDYFSIYKIDEASPGTSTYTAYLDNDNETINMYDSQLDFSNAISTLYIEKGGVNDIDNWIISISKTEGLSWDTSYPAKGENNSGPYNNKIKIGGMTTNTGQVIFTATKSYELSEDTAVDSDKTYYLRSISNNAYVYTIQLTPTGNPHTNNYYEQIPTVTQTKKFSLSKNPTLISHSLRLSSVNANRTSANIYTPTNITLSAIERTGGAGTTDYTAANAITYIIHPVNGNSVTKQGTPPINLTLSSLKDNNNVNIGLIDYIEVFLGGTSANNYEDAEDKQTITFSPIPDSPWQVDLLQVYDSISTNYNYVVNNSATYEIPFKVFKGINLQTLNYPNSNHNNYPTVVATLSGTGTSTITPLYYLENTQRTTANQSIDRIKYNVTNNNTNIGSGGTVTLTFYLDSNTSIVKTYKYQAKTEALNAVTLQVFPLPGDSFTNQEGYLYAEPILTEGATDITDTVVNRTFTWYYYDPDNVNPWQKLKNFSNSSGIGTYYVDFSVGILDTSTNPWTFSKNNGSNIQNGSANSKFLQVKGSGISAYGFFKVEVACTINGTSQTYTGYATFHDYTDPIQVSVHSTLGEELVNGQGIGAIYVRATRGNEEIDSIVPDNYLGVSVGSTAPTNNNFLGYILFNSTNDYTVQYFERNNTTDSWTLRPEFGQSDSSILAQKAKYSWTFRDSDNEPITAESIVSGQKHANIHNSIKYIINNNNQYYPQFIYLDKDVVNKKISAFVKVTV